MEKIIIYEKNGEILIIGNADNVDLLTEYVGLLTSNPFPKCDFSCYIDNSENKIYAVSIRNGQYHFRKRYATYRIAKKQYKKISTTDFQSAMECIDRLVKTATK